MSSVALISQKGGIGRTTIAVNLSYSLARRGWRVLLVDADLQGGIGFSLTEKAKKARGVHDLLWEEGTIEKEAVESLILKTTLPGLRLLTRGSREVIGHVIDDPDGPWASTGRLTEFVSVLGKLDFDLVLYDLPTGVGRVSLGIASKVDYLVVPQSPAPLCLRSLPQMLRTLVSLKEKGAKLAGFVLCMAATDDTASLLDQREFRELLPTEMVLETVIPSHKDFLEASRVGLPVAMLQERPSASALIFDQLAAELEPRISLGDPGENSTHQRKEYGRLVD